MEKAEIRKEESLAVVFVRREAKRTPSVIGGLFGPDLSVDAQMADKANPCLEGSLAVRTGDDRNIWYRVVGSCFSSLPPLLCRQQAKHVKLYSKLLQAKKERIFESSESSAEKTTISTSAVHRSPQYPIVVSTL